MKKVTMADVAKKAGVSKSTVSQYMNGRFEYMSKGTKERIEQAIHELGYRPNIIARSLKQKSTTTIGVIVANILHHFSTRVIRAIEDYCNEHHFHVIVCNADDNPDKEKQYIRMLEAKQVDGMIVFPTGGNVELYQELLNKRYPIVFMDRLVPDISVNAVLLDNEKAAFLAVDEFVNKGYEKIAFISPPLFKNITTRIERLSGYKKALATFNIPVQSEYIVSCEVNNIDKCLQKLLNLPNPPQALLASNDLVLYEILHYAKLTGRKIPGDFALIGIDDVPFANIYQPGLTTVSQPAFDMGKKAAELLLTEIRSKSRQSQTYRFAPTIVKRESC